MIQDRFGRVSDSKDVLFKLHPRACVHSLINLGSQTLKSSMEDKRRLEKVIEDLTGNNIVLELHC